MEPRGISSGGDEVHQKRTILLGKMIKAFLQKLRYSAIRWIAENIASPPHFPTILLRHQWTRIKCKAKLGVQRIIGIWRRKPMIRFAGKKYVPVHVAILCITLTGCPSAPTVPDKVLVPVIRPCVTNPPQKPATTDEKALLAMDEYAATITTWTERLLLKGYAEKADAALQSCR